MEKFCHSCSIFQRLCVKSRENENNFFARKSKEDININVVLSVGVIPWTKEISYPQAWGSPGLGTPPVWGRQGTA